MFLAKFYGHQEIVDYFWRPCPKARLVLNLPRAVSKTAVSMTIGMVIAEPSVSQLTLQVAEQRQGVAVEETFSEANILRGVELVEEEWLVGKTLNVGDLAENTQYCFRLVAVNEAGVTKGDMVRIQTKADKGNSRKSK